MGMRSSSGGTIGRSTTPMRSSHFGSTPQVRHGKRQEPHVVPSNYNGPGKMHRTPPPCLIGGFVAGLGDGHVLSAGRAVSSVFPSEPRPAAMYDSASDAWIEQPSLPADYWPMAAVGLSDGTALVVGQTNDGPEIALHFIPDP
jgi:hypothetical protein